MAANPSSEVAPFRLETTDGMLEADSFGFGRVVWKGVTGHIEVETERLTSPLRVSGHVSWSSG